VEKTYAIVEAGYGIMNEHQVAMGESTCAARYYAFPPSHGGKARIEVREMSRIALERTTTARDAIKLMGALAVELGYYAADFTGGDASKGEGGEALTVIDTEEAWVFHVLADDTGTSAVWAAQRVPDDHVRMLPIPYNRILIRSYHYHLSTESEEFPAAWR
jgi:dipeptidase